jgi:hypothetical protein
VFLDLFLISCVCFTRAPFSGYIKQSVCQLFRKYFPNYWQNVCFGIQPQAHVIPTCTLINGVTDFLEKVRYPQCCWWFARSMKAENRLSLWGRKELNELHMTQIEKEKAGLKE